MIKSTSKHPNLNNGKQKNKTLWQSKNKIRTNIANPIFFSSAIIQATNNPIPEKKRSIINAAIATPTFG
jgi:hypothetical protein